MRNSPCSRPTSKPGGVRTARGAAWLFGWVGRASAVSVGVRRAWAAERLPKLLFPHPGAGPLRIGRDPGNGLRLTHETVSRVHAELSLRDGMWVLKDLGSTNGTTVNGRRVTGSAVVRDGDQIGFGRVTYLLSAGFEALRPPFRGRASPPRAVRTPPVRSGTGAPPGWRPAPSGPGSGPRTPRTSR